MLQWKDIFSHHHAKGSTTLPSRASGAIRLYNMAFCPYGHRVLLIAEAKKIPLEIVNIDLTNAPEWMYSKGFSGVPVLESDDFLIKESLDICEKLCDMKNETRSGLLTTDPTRRKEDRKLAASFQNVVTHIFPLFFKVFEDKEATPYLEKLTKELDVFDKELEKRGSKFFGGNEPGYVDYAIWPFVERLVIMKRLFPTAYDFKKAKATLPLFERWRLAMEDDRVVKVCFLGTDDHTKYIKNRRDLGRGLCSGIDYTYVL